MHRRKQCWRATFLERCHAASCNQRRRKVEEQRQIKSSIVNRQRKHTLELDVDPFIDQTVYKRQRQTVHSNELQMKIKVSVAQTECQPSNTCSNMMSHEVAFLPSDDDDENSNYEKQPAVICPLCCAELLNCQDHNILCSCGMNLDVGASLKPLTYLFDRISSTTNEHALNCSKRLAFTLDIVCKTSLVVQCASCSYYDIVV